MKNKILFFLVLIVLFNVCACADASEIIDDSGMLNYVSGTENDIETDNADGTIDTTHEPAKTVNMSNLHTPEFPGWREDDPEFGVYETKFNNIYIVLEQITYKTTDKIKIAVGNGNGNLFCMCEVPYIQRYDPETEKWEVLEYEPPELSYESSWKMVVGKESYLSFTPQYMQEPLTEGTYRFLVFVDKYTFVSTEFTLTEE